MKHTLANNLQTPQSIMSISNPMAHQSTRSRYGTECNASQLFIFAFKSIILNQFAPLYLINSPQFMGKEHWSQYPSNVSHQYLPSQNPTIFYGHIFMNYLEQFWTYRQFAAFMAHYHILIQFARNYDQTT